MRRDERVTLPDPPAVRRADPRRLDGSALPPDHDTRLRHHRPGGDVDEPGRLQVAHPRLHGDGPLPDPKSEADGALRQSPPPGGPRRSIVAILDRMIRRSRRVMPRPNIMSPTTSIPPGRNQPATAWTTASLSGSRTGIVYAGGAWSHPGTTTATTTTATTTTTTTTTTTRPSVGTSTIPQPPAAVSADGTYTVATTQLDAGTTGAPAATPGAHLATTVWYPASPPDGGAADRPGAPYPLLVFSQGFGVAPARYQVLLAAWASAGYVVAAPTYPHADDAGAAAAGGAGKRRHDRPSRLQRPDLRRRTAPQVVPRPDRRPHLTPYVEANGYETVVANVTTDFFDAELARQPGALRVMAAGGDLPGFAQLSDGTTVPPGGGYCPGAP